MEVEEVAVLARSLLCRTSLEEIGQEAFSAFGRRFSPDAMSMLVVDLTGTALDLVAGQGWSSDHVGKLRLPLDPPDTSCPAYALHLGHAVVEDKTRPDLPFAVPAPVREAGVKTSVVFPMLAGDKKVGAIVLDYLSSRTFSDEDLQLGTALSDVTAVAVDKAVKLMRYRSLFERIPVGLYRLAPSGQILDANEAMARILAFPGREQLVGANAFGFYADPYDLAKWRHLMDRDGAVSGFETRWYRQDGSTVWIRDTSRAVTDATGAVLYYEGSVEDISLRKAVEQKLGYMAYHDSLTGVYNRRRFVDEFERFAARVRRYGDAGAMLFLDLDGFKEVNERFGHREGDRILRGVAQTARRVLREADCLGRLGGDEFGVLLLPCGAEEAVNVANRILQAVRTRGFEVSGQRLTVTASCGVALFPEHGVTFDEVFSVADRGLLAAKAAGGDTVVLGPKAAAGVPSRAERLRSAVEGGRLVAHAQPILDLRTGQVDAWELLVRVADGPDLLLPGSFLPEAERTGLVREIDLWMLGEAVRIAKERGVRVHVNVSQRTLEDEGAVQAICSLADASAIAAGSVVIEITESAVAEGIGTVKLAVEELRGRGFRVALDDFGVGFSPLYYVKLLPVDFIKIDGNFVRPLADDARDRWIVKSIITLAKGVDARTIAEWVEDEILLRIVADLGADCAQGYYVGRPVPCSEIGKGPWTPERSGTGANSQ
jgi:diguanylate cyclase (GGDEF)-like protein/PAS domain S-box-containing protein